MNSKLRYKVSKKHLRSLKWDKNRTGTGERKMYTDTEITFLTWEKFSFITTLSIFAKNDKKINAIFRSYRYKTCIVLTKNI